MLFILTKNGLWKIPGDLWRVLGNGSYCSILEISRKGSWHQGRLLWDDFFGLNHGERRRRENGFVSECELSIPAYWHPPPVAYPAPVQLMSIQTENGRDGVFFKNKRANEEGRTELHSSYVSFLGTSYFIVKWDTTPAKEIMRAIESYTAFW